jgi:fumarate reductase subunit D
MKLFHKNILQSVLFGGLVIVTLLTGGLTVRAQDEGTASNPFFGGSGSFDMTPLPVGAPAPLNNPDPVDPLLPLSSPNTDPYGQADTSGWFDGSADYGNACPSAPKGDFITIIKFSLCFVNNSLIPLLITLSIIVFIWGAIRMILTTGDSKGREEARKFLLWGVIAFFVILTVWGLVHIISSTFGILNLNLTGPEFFKTDPAGYSCQDGFPKNPNLIDLVNFATCRISDLLIPLFVVIALFLFIYGVFRYLASATSDKARKEGSFFMLWGIIALFVILSVWGLVGVLRNTFGVSAIPQFDGKW